MLKSLYALQLEAAMRSYSGRRVPRQIVQSPTGPRMHDLFQHPGSSVARVCVPCDALSIL